MGFQTKRPKGWRKILRNAFFRAWNLMDYSSSECGFASRRRSIEWKNSCHQMASAGELDISHKHDKHGSRNAEDVFLQCRKCHGRVGTEGWLRPVKSAVSRSK